MIVERVKRPEERLRNRIPVRASRWEESFVVAEDLTGATDVDVLGVLSKEESTQLAEVTPIWTRKKAGPTFKMKVNMGSQLQTAA